MSSAAKKCKTKPTPRNVSKSVELCRVSFLGSPQVKNEACRVLVDRGSASDSKISIGYPDCAGSPPLRQSKQCRCKENPTVTSDRGICGETGNSRETGVFTRNEWRRSEQKANLRSTALAEPSHGLPTSGGGAGGFLRQLYLGCQQGASSVRQHTHGGGREDRDEGRAETACRPTLRTSFVALAVDWPIAEGRSPSRQIHGTRYLQIATSGRYHIAVDNNAWVGTVSGIARNIPKGFEGAVGCTAPRKLVDWDLSAPPPRSSSSAPTCGNPI